MITPVTHAKLAGDAHKVVFDAIEQLVRNPLLNFLRNETLASAGCDRLLWVCLVQNEEAALVKRNSTSFEVALRRLLQYIDALGVVGDAVCKVLGDDSLGVLNGLFNDSVAPTTFNVKRLRVLFSFCYRCG